MPVPGATFIFKVPLSRAFRSSTGPMLKVSFGSIWRVPRAIGERPVFAPSGRCEEPRRDAVDERASPRGRSDRCVDASHLSGYLGRNFALNFRQYDIQSVGGRAMLDIRAEVANALHWDIAIPRHRVTAKVDGGWVTLQGVVEWAYQRSLAEAAVRRVPGVTAI